MLNMDGMLSLFETVAQSDCHNVLLQTFLKTCTEHQAFVTKENAAVPCCARILRVLAWDSLLQAPVVIQSVVAHINGKLNSSATRYDGLLLLKTFLPQCSVEIFGENVIFWMQQCLKSVEGGQNKHALANVSYQVLKILLQMSEQMPEMKRVISGNVVTKIIDNIQQISTQEASLSMLECLEVLMCNYGPSCGQQKSVVEKCVLQYVDTSDINVIKRIAHCVAFLPLLGGGGPLGASHVSRWKQEQQKVCATLHCFLDELFDNVREIPSSRNSVTSGQALSLPPISESTPLLRVYQLMARFINVSKFLQALLISEFPVEKTVLPDEILGVICRGLAVNSHTMGKKVSADLLMVGAMLPQIHIALLKVLDCLIICCGCNLLPYAPVVCKLVLQTLKWTSTEKWAYGIEKPYGQLRVAAYNTLTLWLQISKCGSCVELISEQLVPVMMQDIWFEKEAVTLNVHSTSSKKQQKCDQSTSEQQGVWSSRKYIPDQKANSKTCRAALQVLQCMLHSAATFIKPSVHRLLQETAVGLIFDIQRASRAHDFPVPYAETSCRLELYNLLHTLVLEPHSTWPPPTQFAFHMLSAGCSDPSLEVSHFCTAALIAVEKLVHPASGTLHFPVSLEEMLESTRRYRQEYYTKPKESSSFVETSEEGDIQNDVHSSAGSSGSEPVMCHTDNAENSSEEVVIEYDSRMEGEGGDETDEYEEEHISECELATVDSEESDSSMENDVSQLSRLSEMLSKTLSKEKVLVIETSESDEDLLHKEEKESAMGIRGENCTHTNVGVCKKNVSKHYNSRIDNKIHSGSCVTSNQEPSVVISTDSKKSIYISADLDNEGKLLSDQQQMKSTENGGVASNKCEKGSKDITASTEISAAGKSLLVTENEEDRQDNCIVWIVQEDDDDSEPNSKRMKLDLPESPKKHHKSDAETSDCNVKDCTAVPITMNGKEKQQANGVGQDPEEPNEEEMLQAFVNALAE